MAKRTPNQIAYQKEVKRIERFLKSAQKKGYTFSQLPKLEMPKRVTKKRLERIKAIKPVGLYAHAIYHDPSGGAIPANVHRAGVRKAAAAKAAKTKRIRSGWRIDAPIITTVILDNVREEIARWRADPRWDEKLKERKTENKNLVERILNSALEQYGENTIAYRLEQSAEEVGDIIKKALYAYREDIVQAAIVRFALILKGTLTREENEQLTEYSELI